jgi:hypothetical protein
MSTSNMPNLDGQELKSKVENLKAKLLARDPNMPLLLREIHVALREQPENVTLLAEEEIAVIVEGLTIQTGVEFSAAVTKSPAASKSVNARIKALGADAF